LNFDTDQDFIDAVGVPADNYMNLWVTTLHVTPATAGNWTFRDADRDDWSGLWLDINQNGTFESTTAGLGSNRGEQLAWNDQGAKTVNLAAGDYTIAFFHLEGGGGSRMEFRFQSPLMGAEATIMPSNPAQAGIWNATFIDATIDNQVNVVTDSTINNTGGRVTLTNLASATGTTVTMDGSGEIIATAPQLSGQATIIAEHVPRYMSLTGWHQVGHSNYYIYLLAS
jgi:hypothetical protein